MAVDNRTLDRFDLPGIPPAPRGTPKIEVAFDIDANGILNVSARDEGTGKEHQVKITTGSGLSEEEVEKMKQEAEANAELDKTRRELIETRNKAEMLVYEVEKSVGEHGDMLDEAEKTAIDEAKKAVKEVIEGDDQAAIESKMEELQKASYKLAEKVYKEQQAQQAQAGPEAGPTQSEAHEKKDDVIDADFEVKS